MNLRLPVLLTALTLTATSGIGLRASPVTVTDNGMGANDSVHINSSTLGNNIFGYAGIVDLTVVANGVTTNVDGFCIDPWHYSVSYATSDNLEPLASAPKPPGPMSAAAAIQIEQLWAQYMTTSYALSSNSSTADEWAAALQLEIWQTVANSITTPGVSYSLSSITNHFSGEASAITSDESAMAVFLTGHPNAPTANLAALSGEYGQDYVIQTVPDGGATGALLGLACLGLLAWSKRQANRLIPMA